MERTDAKTGALEVEGPMETVSKNKKEILLRHFCVATFGALMVYLNYLSYGAWGVEPALWPDWGHDHPFWRAWGHAAFILLFFALILGPVAKLWHPVKRLLPWRRELGIWFTVFGAGHAYAIWDRWALGEFAGFFGGRYSEQLGAYVLARPEVAIMNMMLVVVAPMAILLAVTSFNKAIRFLGGSSWKWLHSNLIHAIFYILMLRGVLYFFFFFQAAPPDWRIYPNLWFLNVFLGMGMVVVLLQAAAFVKTVYKRNDRKQRHGGLQIAALIAVAALFVMPMALMAGTVAYFDGRVVNSHITQPGPASTPPASTFHMAFHETDQDIHLWARDLDTAPYFRQTIESAGSPVSHQIYRSSERALYTAERDGDEEFVWSKSEDVGPEQIGIPSILAGPGAWAADYGPGTHQIQMSGMMVQVTIHSVQEPIPDDVFAVPEDV